MKKEFSLLVTLFVLMLSSCDLFKSEVVKVRGCTNPNSINYNSKAEEDDGTCCLPTNDVQKGNINAVDGKTGSVFATFQFSQESTFYKGLCSGKSPECFTNLIIENNTNRNIQFGYIIIYTLNAASWNYQNVATISPRSTLNVGLVSKNCASLTLGKIVIQPSGNGVTYF
jgi:hypothetical protein